MKKRKKLAVIGSGIAGIASAIRLSGYFDVTVYESAESPGGKIGELYSDGFRYDTGPSLFTLPELVDELFLIHNKEPGKYYSYQKLDVIYRSFFDDGSRLDVSSDPVLFAENVERQFGVPENEVISYLEKSRIRYEATKSIFLEKSLHRLSTYFSPDIVRALMAIPSLSLFSTMNRVNRRFRQKHMTQLFDRYATYNGSSPYKAPGILTMIPHLEFNLGAYFPEGGMRQIIKALYKLAVEEGVRFRFNSPVKRIEVTDNVVKGVETNEEKHFHDIVVSNMDLYYTYKYLMPDVKAPEKLLSQPKSSSALVFYWNMERTFPELDLHNIFFSKNYEDEFNYIFGRKELYHDPTVYVNISAKVNPSDAPEGMENWFVMINVPPDRGQDWQEMADIARRNIIKKLNEILGTDIEKHIAGESILDPKQIENKTSSYGGSLYGNSSNSKLAAFLRHPNFSRDIKGLYFCGGSVHPGGGIPLCLNSAKIVSKIIKDDYCSP